jgi:hypothetical protein
MIVSEPLSSLLQTSQMPTGILNALEKMTDDDESMKIYPKD